MKTYSESEAAKQLAELLDEADRSGCVAIRRRDGQTFMVQPQQPKRSPLDVDGIDLGLGREETVELVREGRERG